MGRICGHGTARHKIEQTFRSKIGCTIARPHARTHARTPASCPSEGNSALDYVQQTSIHPLTIYIYVGICLRNFRYSSQVAARLAVGHTSCGLHTHLFKQTGYIDLSSSRPSTNLCVKPSPSFIVPFRLQCACLSFMLCPENVGHLANHVLYTRAVTLKNNRSNLQTYVG